MTRLEALLLVQSPSDFDKQRVRNAIHLAARCRQSRVPRANVPRANVFRANVFRADESRVEESRVDDCQCVACVIDRAVGATSARCPHESVERALGRAPAHRRVG